MEAPEEPVRFDVRRALLLALVLGAPAAVVAGLLGGAPAGLGALLGIATGSLAFSWLARSLRSQTAPLLRKALVIGSIGRMALWAATGMTMAALGGAAGGGGFLAGAVLVKAAVLTEGIRSGGG